MGFFRLSDLGEDVPRFVRGVVVACCAIALIILIVRLLVFG